MTGDVRGSEVGAVTVGDELLCMICCLKEVSTRTGHAAVALKSNTLITTKQSRC